MQGNLKLVFAGPTGAGKTTAVAAICDGPVVTTSEQASDEVADLKPRTTVALDYGIATLGGMEPIHIYGTPGQERFSFMWEILTRGGSGLVLLAKADNPDPLGELTYYLETFRDYIHESAKLAIGVTHADRCPGLDLDGYRAALREMDLAPPVMAIDPRRREDVTALIQALMASMSPFLRRAVY